MQYQHTKFDIVVVYFRASPWWLLPMLWALRQPMQI